MMEGKETHTPEDILFPWTTESNTTGMGVNHSHIPDAPLFLLILMPTVSVWTIISNIFVVFAVLTNKTFRRDPHMLVITSLALSDACVGLSTVPANVILTNPTSVFRKPMVCSAAFQTLFASVAASSIHIVLICVERITAIMKPHQFKKLFTLKRNLIYSMGIWLFSFAVFCVPPILWLRKEDFVLPVTCAARTVFLPEKIGLSYVAVCMIVIYCIAFPIFGFLLFKVRQLFKQFPRPSIQIASVHMNTDTCNTVDAQLKTETQTREGAPAAELITGASVPIVGVNMHTDPCNTVAAALQTEAYGRIDAPNENIPTSRVHVSKKKSDAGKLKTVMFLFVLFTLTLLPNNLVFLYGIIFDELINQQSAFLIGYIWVLNSSINPFVYAVTIDKFKQGIKSAICNCFRPLHVILRR